MHSATTIEAALALADDGANACEIARRLDVPRTTVRDWLRGLLPHSVPHGTSGAQLCAQCGHAVHNFGALSASYVYLLGLYLGDGCITRHRRDVYRLRITLDARYPGIIENAASAIAAVRGGKAHVQPRRRQNCSDVSGYWRSWPCLFPQHGAGLKHARRIVLTEWQERLVDRWPEHLLRGLIHSDGCRFQNTGRGNWSCPRYSFTNHSADIRDIFCRVCERVGVRWTLAGAYVVYVSRKADVARLDEFIGPKQ
jgi:hypothetical protein